MEKFIFATVFVLFYFVQYKWSDFFKTLLLKWSNHVTHLTWFKFPYNFYIFWENQKSNFEKVIYDKKNNNLLVVLYKPQLMYKQYFRMYLKIRFSMPHCLTYEQTSYIHRSSVTKPRYCILYNIPAILDFLCFLS